MRTPQGPRAPAPSRARPGSPCRPATPSALVRGRPAAPGKPAIIGLFGFADRLRGIWQGARQDDPYADWWLIKIHDALVAAEQRIQAGQQTLAERRAASPALEVMVAAS